MFSDIKTNVAQIATSTKTAFWTTIGVYISDWYVEWGNPLISALTSMLGLVMLVILIRYHLLNTKKVQNEIKEQEEKNHKPEQ